MKRQLRALGLGHDPRRGPGHHRRRLLPLDAVDLPADLQLLVRRRRRPGPADRRAGRRAPRPGRVATPDGRAFDDAVGAPSSARSSTRTASRTSPRRRSTGVPGLGTVLANEEVTADGRSERGNFPVYKRPLKQWMMRITAYADRLLADLDELDWTESIKLMQRNWIGRSTGALGALPGRRATTDVDDRGVHDAARHAVRRDLHGARARAPARRRRSPRTSGPATTSSSDWSSAALDAWKGMFGATGTPADAVDALPRVRGGEVGARTPGRGPREDRRVHRRVRDQPHQRRAHPDLRRRLRADGLRHRRDHGRARARRTRLRVRARVRAADRAGDPAERRLARRARRRPPTTRRTWPEAYVGDGVGDELRQRRGVARRPARRRRQARDRRVARERDGSGEPTVTYKLRDWLFSRQRYWGEPFPIVYDDVGPIALPESLLPVELPEITDFEPATSDDPDALPEPPLARAADWVEVELDLPGPAWAGYGAGQRAYLRETNTMPQWAGSCWYYLRYLDPTNEDALVDPAVERAWAQGTRADGSPKSGLVDLYVGGVEHAVLHLLYARFWHKVLFDLGHVSTIEPFQRLVNQGMILAAAYTDERGMYVEAVGGRRARRRVLLRRRAGHARVRQDGQEPEERGHARRHLRRVRRRHAAPLRDVHGPARRVAPVEHRRHHRRAPLPAAAVAQRRSTRRPATSRVVRRAGRRRDAAACCTARSPRCATTWRR